MDTTTNHTDMKKADSKLSAFSNLVGVSGFEPPTLCTPCRCATRLRHTPYNIQQERNYNSTISAALAPGDNQISSQARIEASSARSELAPRRPLVVAGAGVVAGRLASRALRMRRTNSTS